MKRRLDALDLGGPADTAEQPAALGEVGETGGGGGDAVAGKGLILPSGGNHVVFLELRPSSRGEGRLFLPGLESNQESSLKSEEEAGRP